MPWEAPAEDRARHDDEDRLHALAFAIRCYPDQAEFQLTVVVDTMPARKKCL